MTDGCDPVKTGIFGIVLPNAILVGSAGVTAGLVRLSSQLSDSVERHGMRLMAAVAAAPVELVHEEVCHLSRHPVSVNSAVHSRNNGEALPVCICRFPSISFVMFLCGAMHSCSQFRGYH
jgi:hypothetical protein